MLDLTDLGFIQTLCLLMAMLSVFWENVGRAGAGYYVSRDRQLGLWTLTYFLGMDFYVKLLTVGFFLHSLVPLWVDQVETTSLYAFLLGTYWVAGVQVISALTLILALVFASQRVPYWAPLFAMTAAGWAWGLGDTLTSGLGSANSDPCGPAEVTPCGFTPSSCTYEARMGGSEFEWHKSTMYPNSFFFFDLASLLYAILLAVCLAVLLYVICMGIIGYYMGGHSLFSYTHRAIILRLLEHGLASVCGGLLMMVGIGFRVGFEHYTVGL